MSLFGSNLYGSDLDDLGIFSKKTDSWMKIKVKPGLFLFKKEYIHLETNFSTDIENNLLFSEEESNVTFLVKDKKKIPAHKLILCSRRFVYFSKCFSEEFAKLLIKKQKTYDINLEEYTKAEVEEFVRFIYTGFCNFDNFNVFPLIELSLKFKIQQLNEFCYIFLENIIDLNIICALITKSQKKGFDTSFQGKLKSFFSKNVSEILENSTNFCNLDPKSLIYLISDDTVPFNEADLFIAVVKWLAHYEKILDKKQYKSLEEEVIQHIRFGCMDQDELKNIVAPTYLCPDDVFKVSLKYSSDLSLNKPSGNFFFLN
jgi:hypothetical protein